MGFLVGICALVWVVLTTIRAKFFNLAATLVTAHSAQKTPDKLEPRVGEKVPLKLKLDAMPSPLINQEPVLKQ